MTQIRVNIRTAVNAAAIRREMHNGREHIVVPSFTLPDGVVMNDGMYPHDEIEAGYKSLEMTPAPLGHPQVNGEYVSASRMDAVNAFHFGAFNKNVRREGNRIYLEKFIDVEVAQNSENGRKVLAAIDKGDPIHTSTGLLLEREMTPNAEGYKWIARNLHFDHDAVLVGQVGAATPADGVGMLVNRQLVINSEIPQEDEQPTEAEQQVNEDSLFDRILTRIKEVIQLSPKQPQPLSANETEELPDMTPQELQAALDAQADKLQGAFNEALAALKAENETQLAAVNAKLAVNETAALAGKRAIVAEKLGEVIANSLSGEALDDAVARCAVAAPIVGGFQGNQEEADEMAGYSINSHMKEAK